MQFSVDTDRCVSCGLCLSDCLPRALGMDEEGHPYIKDERLCMHCHHCLALCPTGAISVDGHNPDASRRILNAWPQPEQLENLIKGRRSVRQYRPENVDPALLQQVDDQTPPAFLFATQGDHLVPATQSLQFATLLAERKIPYEMHIFAYGDHGFSTGSRHIANPQNPENPETAVWQGMALGFLNHIFNHDVLVPAPEEVKEFCLDMKIGTLLDTPQSAALIQQLLPELAQYVQQEPGSRGISVNDLQFYSNKMFDEEKLAALNEALAKLN